MYHKYLKKEINLMFVVDVKYYIYFLRNDLSRFVNILEDVYVCRSSWSTVQTFILILYNIVY